MVAAARRESLKSALREATERAGDLGVRGVPSIVVNGEVFWGDDRLEQAVSAAARTQRLS
jgi:2-hydroxychromene-2-carboxylate isomerase